MFSRSIFKSFGQLTPRATSPAAQCYRPDGTAVASDELVPCNGVLAAQGQGSMCCSLGLNSQNDTCDPTGLCKNDGSFYRDSCSDKTWSSANCLNNVCMNPLDYGSNATFSLLYNCGTENGDPAFCCGNGRSDCCGNTTAVFTLAPTLVAQGVSQATATVTVTSAAGANTQSKSSGTSGATIGLAVVLGVVFLASVAGFFLLGRKLRKRLPPKGGFAGGDANVQGYNVPANYYDTYHEAPTGPGAAELSSGQQHLMYPPGVSELGQPK